MKTIKTTTLLVLLLTINIGSIFSQTFVWSNNQANGSLNESGNGVCTDTSGNIYVVGNTNSSDFSTTAGAYQISFGGGPNDIFIQKYNSSGILLWSTYFGGNSDDMGTQIATDSSGNVYITGGTYSLNFPVTPGAFQAVSGGGMDAFVAKFNTNGMLMWSTYYGGSGDETGYDIAINNLGNVYVTGNTFSGNFPVTGGAYQVTSGGASDAFIFGMNSTGTQLWSSYVGGSATDAATSIAIDNTTNNIYLTGKTMSANFPVTIQSGAYNQASIAGATDGFITKFNSLGFLLWSTYFGGTSLDVPNSISCDNNGNIWIAGYTASVNLPTQNPGSGYFQVAYAGGSTDGMFLKLNSSDSLVWSTYYGGTSADYGMSISAVNDSVYATGTTNSTNFPTTPASGAFYQGTFGGGSSDGFLLRLNSSTSVLLATYFGGTGNESGNGITTNASDVTYLTGTFDNTLHLTVPTTMTSAGGSDGFLGKLFNCSSLSMTIQTTLAISCFGGSNGVLAANPSGGTAPYSFMWSMGSTGQTVSNLVAGSYSCTAIDANGCSVTTVSSIMQPAILTMTNSVIPASCGGNNGSASAFPAGGTAPYFYTWSTLATTQTVSSLSVGVYSVVATDINGCNIINQVFVTDSCGNYSPVWPGDCNYDLKADFWDFLNIGVAYGQTGPTRPNANNSWTAQPAPNWSSTFPAVIGGNNYKHADCNGDGTVNINDTTALLNNYGLTHLKKPNVTEHIATNPDLYLVANVDTANKLQAVNFDIYLGAISLPIDSLYGIAYKINYNTSLTKQKPTITYTNSWLGNPATDLISFEKAFHSTGFVDLAVSRNNQINKSGSGKIGTCGIVTTDNLSGFDVLSVTISDIKAITFSGTIVNLNGVSDSVVINPNAFAGIKTEDLEKTISIYPNPSKGFVVVKSTAYEMSEIKINNLLGETVMSINNPSDGRINVLSLAVGVYTVGVKINESWIYQRLVVSH